MPIGEWYHLRISNLKTQSGEYEYKIKLNGEVIYTHINTHPEVFYNLIARRAHDAQADVKIRNFSIETYHEG